MNLNKIKRLLNFQLDIEDSQSIFLFGPRGVGKTYLVMAFLEKYSKDLILSIDLLLEEQRIRYLKKPDQLVKEVDAFCINKKDQCIVFIDEIQKIPKMCDSVHHLIEKYYPKLIFILTGSSARKLKREGANLLAARATTHYLYPLSALEISDVNFSLSMALKIGTMPRPFLQLKRPIPYLSSYVKTYLKEEIRIEAKIRKIDEFNEFLILAAQNNAEPINYEKIAKEIGVSSPTIHEYYNILEDTLIATKVNGWNHSIRKQLIQQPRYYFFDCGIVNILNGLDVNNMNESGYYYGKLFETWMINEIVKINEYFQLGYSFYYWRTKSGAEIDLILVKALKPLIAIEIKLKSIIEKEDIKELLAIKSEYPQIESVVLSQTTQGYYLEHVFVTHWKVFLEKLQRV